MGAPLCLTPTMRSRKLQALDFIKGYFAEHGGSPSLSEIAAKLGVSRQRAHELVEQLAAEELILHTPGKPRGLALVEPTEELSQGDALLRLKGLGWVVDNEARTVGQSLVDAVAPLTNVELLMLPLLDHKPDQDIDGTDRSGTSAGS